MHAVVPSMPNVSAPGPWRGPGQRHLVAVATALDGPEAWRVLAPVERRVCAALPTRSRRRDFRAGRLAAGMARARLELALRRAPAADGRGLGQPPAAREGTATRSRVSIAHRDGRALAAAVPSWNGVGVDLERRGAVRPRETVYFLGERELPLLGALDATALWALKEAAWKLFDCHEATPFHALRLSMTPEAAGALAQELPAALEILLAGHGRAVRARLVAPWRGYVAAIVTDPEAERRIS